MKKKGWNTFLNEVLRRKSGSKKTGIEKNYTRRLMVCFVRVVFLCFQDKTFKTNWAL